jgi:hypothetical protein
MMQTGYPTICATVTIRRSPNGSYRTFFTVNFDNGTVLTGTWRQRGIIATSGVNQGAFNNTTSPYYGEPNPMILCQRSA